MYLHNNKELFKDLIANTSEYFGIDFAIVEKDYYVTMILKVLSRKTNLCVFKGGTSLSKAYNIINRFSEDVDITFSEHIGAARRKKIKYSIVESISKELDIPISNFNDTESDKDLNCYLFQYKSMETEIAEELLPEVRLEVSLNSYSFPYVEKEIDCYICRFLEKENPSIIEKFDLGKFKMKTQSLERTFIDKIFALCDYYMIGKSKRYSRHLYDLFKLSTYITINNTFKELIKEVRKQRRSMVNCPSAKNGVNVESIVKEFCQNDFYKNDYELITKYFINDNVDYKTVKENILSIVDKGIFN